MLVQISWTRAGEIVAIGILICGPVNRVCAQAPSAIPRATQKQATQAKSIRPNIYEDSEVKFPVPSGWSVSVPDNHAISKKDYPATPQTFAPTPGSGIFLSKNGYTLTLAFESGHASGVTGGRLIEILQVPWIDDPFEGVDCSSLLRRNKQPVNRTLVFINFILDPNDSEIREKCEIPNDFGGKASDEGTKDHAVGQRWFAGQFTTTVHGGWFFESDGVDCGEKAYILTSAARTPIELPLANDLALKKVIQEAIGMVASIHYKRCPPSDIQPR